MSKFKKPHPRSICWSDNDRYFGPFTYARDRHYRKFGVMLGSGDNDDYPGCRIRLSIGSHTLIAALPPLIRPWRKWVDSSGYQWSNGPGSGYYDIHQREYGFTFFEGALHVHSGPQTHSSDTSKSKVYFYPWREHQIVRHTLYDPSHAVFAQLPIRNRIGEHGWTVQDLLRANCPTQTFRFNDFDGEEIDVVCRVEEREWRRGKGVFRLLFLGRNCKDRCLDLRFLKEMGRRKGSWKGGTIGHSCKIGDGEPPIEAFRRYCVENKLTFIEEVTLPATTETCLAAGLASE